MIIKSNPKNNKGESTDRDFGCVTVIFIFIIMLMLTNELHSLTISNENLVKEIKSIKEIMTSSELSIKIPDTNEIILKINPKK